MNTLYKIRGFFHKGLKVKTFVLSSQVKSVVLDLEGFTELLSLSMFGLNSRYRSLKHGRHKFLILQNLKCLKIKNKYIGHLSKLVFDQVCVVTRFP